MPNGLAAKQVKVSDIARSERRPTAARNFYPFYAHRFWQGMPVSIWLRILIRNRAAISPARIPRALRLCLYSIFNSALGVAQTLAYGSRIDRATLTRPPLFIIGHWRTGTTLLHEILTLGDDFTAPTILECSAPWHFLVSGPVLRRLGFYLPAKRPMDDVSVTWNSPQEDEFALLNMGAKSPYETMMFPNRRHVATDFITPSGPDEIKLGQWKNVFLRFLQSVNFRAGLATQSSADAKRIVLKSPPHTARLRILREMFPNAQYIHMVRNPYEVFSSTVLLWHSLYETQGMQKPCFDEMAEGIPGIEDYVLEVMEVLYRDFLEQIEGMPAEQFCEVRYENLVHSPVDEVERVYRKLGLGDFRALRPKLDVFLRERQHYRINRHAISQHYRSEVYRRWRWYFDRYDYSANWNAD